MKVRDVVGTRLPLNDETLDMELDVPEGWELDCDGLTVSVRRSCVHATSSVDGIEVMAGGASILIPWPVVRTLEKIAKVNL